MGCKLLDDVFFVGDILGDEEAKLRKLLASSLLFFSLLLLFFYFYFLGVWRFMFSKSDRDFPGALGGFLGVGEPWVLHQA